MKIYIKGTKKIKYGDYSGRESFYIGSFIASPEFFKLGMAIQLSSFSQTKKFEDFFLKNQNDSIKYINKKYTEDIKIDEQLIEGGVILRLLERLKLKNTEKYSFKEIINKIKTEDLK